MIDNPPPSDPTHPDELPRRSVEELSLRRPPFWTVGPLLMATMGSVLLLDLVVDVGTAVMNGQDILAILGGSLRVLTFALVGGVYFGYRAYSRSRPLGPIKFFDRYIELPTSVHGNARRQIPYDDILFIRMGGHPPHLRILVESREHLFFFDQSSFVDPAGPELVFLELRRRILNLPQGREIIQRMREREQITGKALALRPWATQILLGIIAVIYLNQTFTQSQGNIASPLFDIVAWGAVVPQLVREGELYRLLSANFLHMSTVHIVVNGIALFSLGSVMERFLGWERFIVVYLLSGLGATVVSSLSHPMTAAAGASGCILGIFGALAVVNIKYWHELPMGFFRQPKRWWVFIIGINAALPILFPVVDVAGHLGGLAVGMLVTWLLLRGHDATPSAPAGTVVRTLALALIAMFAVGVGTAVVMRGQYNAAKRSEYTVMFAEQMLAKEADGRYLNDLAYSIALSPEANEEQLALAEKMAQRALGEGPQLSWMEDTWLKLTNTMPQADELYRIATQDTLATVYFRQGRADEAARLELQAVEAAGRLPTASPNGDEQWFGERWSQLQRMLAARVEAKGPLVDFPLDPEEAPGEVTALEGDGRWHVDTQLLKLGVERPRGKRPRLALQVAPPTNKPLTVYALVWKGPRRVGMLRVEVGRNPPSQLVHRPASTFPLTDDMELELAAVRYGTLEDVPVGAARWRWHPMDPKVANWPR